MHTFVYASSKKPDTYVWLQNNHNIDELLPEALCQQLGNLRYVLELELDAKRSLPHANAANILKMLKQQGWYLQLPPRQ